MSTDRIAAVQGNLTRFLTEASAAEVALAPNQTIVSGTTLTAGTALDLFEDQVTSRAIDIEARRLKADGLSFYTISSAGHEQNALLGTLLRTTDPCLLHYRSGGLMMSRGRRGGVDRRVLDTMLSICASSDDPVGEGRHKVWGSRDLWVPPQTSTIASHLPKAVGTAFSIGRARRMGIESGLPEDSIVMCSFGDASANHATALTGIQAARYGNRRGNPLPILFVCEDNGMGISTDTPQRWIRDTFSGRSHMRYVEADGDLISMWNSVEEAVRICRETRSPVFLRLVTVRLWGHAGSDIELAYRSQESIEETESRDPILANARFLVERGIATPPQLLEMIDRIGGEVREAGIEAAGRPHLSVAEDIMRPLAPFDRAVVEKSAAATVQADRRREFWGRELPEETVSPIRRTMAAHLSSAMADEMLKRPEILVFGEDVGRKGGVYYVTAGLQKRFGTTRVIDTHLDETSILGLAQGAGMLGLLPVPEIQYLAYVHNAVDQIRGEAASLQFFSNGQFQNPMVIRIAGFAYQRGFGGHFHNDHAIGGLRDIPGLVMAAPSRSDDAARMLRGCMALAQEQGRVVAFLEPIALYHQKDLHEDGDGGWLSDYPSPEEYLLPGDVGLEGEGEILLISYANGFRMSLQAQKILEQEHGLKVRVMDLRWLNPLPLEAIDQAAAAASAVLMVDECRSTGGGVAEAVVSHLAEGDFSGRLRSLRAPDSFVPLGPAANAVLIQTPDIVKAVLALKG